MPRKKKMSWLEYLAISKEQAIKNRNLLENGRSLNPRRFVLKETITPEIQERINLIDNYIFDIDQYVSGREKTDA